MCSEAGLNNMFCLHNNKVDPSVPKLSGYSMRPHCILLSSVLGRQTDALNEPLHAADANRSDHVFRLWFIIPGASRANGQIECTS